MRESCWRDWGREGRGGPAPSLQGFHRRAVAMFPLISLPVLSGWRNMPLDVLRRTPPAPKGRLSGQRSQLVPGLWESQQPRVPGPRPALWNSPFSGAGLMPRCFSAPWVLPFLGPVVCVRPTSFALGSMSVCPLESLPSSLHGRPEGPHRSLG